MRMKKIIWLHTWSSQLAVPLWTDLGIKSVISMCELTSTWREKKNGKWEMNG